MRRRRRRRLSLSAVVAIAVLVATVGTAALLDRRRSEAQVAELVGFAGSARMEPVDLVLRGARSNRIILLGDVHPLGAPKRIAAEAIEALAQGPGLDAVVLEVDASLQPVIDRYLSSDPEDAALLSANAGTLRGGWGPWHDYLGIYRTVWRLNRTLGPARRIRVVAADLPGWPPEGTLPPHAAAAQYARRDAHMAERIEDEVLRRNPRARLLVFVGGYHVLEHGGARLHSAGRDPIALTWLGAHLRERHPAQVYSIIVDGPARGSAFGPIVSFNATRAADLFRRRLVGTPAPFGLPLDEHFDFLRDAIREAVGPGLRLEILPADYRLPQVADGYIYLGPRAL